MDRDIFRPSPLPFLIVSVVKAQIPIQSRLLSGHKTSQLMPNRKKKDTELTGHACDSHCAHQDRFGLVSRTDAKSNKAPNHQPEQNAVPEGLETSNDSVSDSDYIFKP